MKTKNIIFFFLLLTLVGHSQTINFPDPNFRDYLINNYDINRNRDSILEVSEARAYMGAISCSGKNISDLTGIEHFIQITGLYCRNNSIEVLDASMLNKLENLNISNNKLKVLNLTNRESFLRQMDATNNPDLTCIKIDKDYKPYWEWKKDSIAEYNFYCDSYPYTVNIPDANFKSFLVNTIDENNDGEIQISEAEKTFGLDCSNQSIQDLTGIEAFRYLEALNCSSNALTSLNLNSNKFLKQLVCNNNQLTTLIADKIDLEVLDCSFNAFKEIQTSSFTSLKIFDCSNNVLEAIALQDNLELVNFTGNNNSLIALNAIRNNKLEKVLCHNNQLEILELKNKNNALLQVLDARNNPNLTCISIDSNFTPPLTWGKDSQANYNDSCFNADAIIDIPDANFKAYLIGNTEINTNGDAHIQMSEARDFTGEINCGGKRISTLVGIEYFENIAKLNCAGNDITELFLEKNIQLVYLNFSRNEIREIDLSKNLKLKTLYCEDSSLGSLDITNNKELIDLNISHNVIKELDLSQNTLLEEFNADHNGLKSLDVSNNKNLKTLRCTTNKLTDLNLANTNNEALMILDARYNWDLYCINIDEGFDPATNPERDWKKEDKAKYSDDCYGTKTVIIPDANFKSYLLAEEAINTNGDNEIQFSEAKSFYGSINCYFMDIEDLTGIEAFINISDLYCQGNKLSHLDISNNPYLYNVDCSMNNLTELNTSSNSYLEGLYCGLNAISVLDISNNPNLKSLHCHINQINSLDVSKNPFLVDVYCFKNELETLDFSAQKDLNLLDCANNKLTSLNIANGNNENIGHLYVQYNYNLFCIKIDQDYKPLSNWIKDDAAVYNSDCDTAVEVVTIPDENFKAYLLSNKEINTNGDNEIQLAEAQNFYDTIDCGNLQISDLTGIEAFVNLSSLYCYANPISTIDISNNKRLLNFNCINNNLTTLDVSQNTNLLGLYCSGNQLQSIDLTNNTELLEFYCDYNFSLTSLNIANGNNDSILNFNTTYTALNCIQIDQGFEPGENWVKEDNATFSDNCNAFTGRLKEEKARLYPNPVANQIAITTDEKVSKVEVFNVFGGLELTFKNKEADVSKLASGIYMLKIYTDNEDVIIKRFLKK